VAEIDLSLASTGSATSRSARGNTVDWIRSRVHPPSDVRGLISLLLTFIGARIIVSFVAFAGYILAPTNPVVGFPASFPEYPLLDPWIRGDALSYLIASNPRFWLDTFSASGGTMPLPVLPALLAIVRSLDASAVLGSVAIVNAALLLAIVALDRLVTPRFGRSVTTRAALILLIFPFGFRLAMAEPFALVLLFALLAFLGIDRNRPGLTAIAGALAALTHPIGLAIWPAAAVAQVRGPFSIGSRWRRAYGALSLVVMPAVVIGYAAYVHSTAGLQWQHVIKTVLGVPGFSLTRAIGSADARGVAFVLGFNLLMGVLVAFTTPRVVATLGWPYAVYQIGILILVELVNPSGLGTGAAVAFPGFIIAAVALEKHEIVESLWIALSSLGVGFAAAAFVQWYPIAGASAAPPLMSSQPAHASFRAHLLVEDSHLESPPLNLDAIADDTLVFLGYRPIESRYAPGQSVPISLYLYTLKTPDQGYLLSARLHDRQGQERARIDRTFWGSADEVLFQSTDDRSLLARRYFRELLDLPIDRAVPPGAYELDVQLFRIPSFAAVPVIGEDQKSSDRLLQTELIVADPRDFVTAGSLAVSHSSNAELGDGIGFLGFDLAPLGPDRTLAVALYWQARTRPAWDYTVFVQALDDQGKLVAQSDSYPWSGGLPTSTWQPGWAIRDVHALQLPANGPTGKIHLIAGMYRLETMQRLSVRLTSGTSSTDYLDLGKLVLS
jgi:hypothetical protein